jgi:hypothetical protein
MQGCSDDNDGGGGGPPRGRGSASSMEWPAVLHTTAMEPTLKHEGGSGLGGRPAALVLEPPTLATASSVTGGAPGGSGRAALRRGASGLGSGGSRGPGTPTGGGGELGTPRRRTGAILEALLESPRHGGSGDGGDADGRRVRSRGPTPHDTPKGGRGGGGGGGLLSSPIGASAFTHKQASMAALMASVLRQSLGVADPSMHALAAGTSHLHAMYKTTSCPVEVKREAASATAVVQVLQPAVGVGAGGVGGPGAAIILPKATCRGPSFLAACKSV